MRGESDARVSPYSWSLAWVKRRIAAHRRASELESGHMAAFHMQQADLWESQVCAFLERRGEPKVRVLDFYREAPSNNQQLDSH